MRVWVVAEANWDGAYSEPVAVFDNEQAAEDHAARVSAEYDVFSCEVHSADDPVLWPAPERPNLPQGAIDDPLGFIDAYAAAQMERLAEPLPPFLTRPLTEGGPIKPTGFIKFKRPQPFSERE